MLAAICIATPALQQRLLALTSGKAPAPAGVAAAQPTFRLCPSLSKAERQVRHRRNLTTYIQCAACVSGCPALPSVYLGMPRKTKALRSLWLDYQVCVRRSWHGQHLRCYETRTPAACWCGRMAERWQLGVSCGGTPTA